jgi:predicted enzyme related to lactoylglutathione lyase
MDRVSHFEIPTADKARSKAFYTDVFGWQIADVPVEMDGGTGTYTSAMTVPVDQTMMPTEPGAINGALIAREGRFTAPVLTVTVESIDGSLKKVTAAGGKVVEGKRTITNMGHYAYVTDPDGNVIGLWQDLPRQG